MKFGFRVGKFIRKVVYIVKIRSIMNYNEKILFWFKYSSVYLFFGISELKFK